MNKISCVTFFSNFSNLTRLNILYALKNKECEVNKLSKELEIEQSLVSHNLKKLQRCNLVFAKRIGKTKRYALNKNIALPILKAYEKYVWDKHCKKCKFIKNT